MSKTVGMVPTGGRHARSVANHRKWAATCTACGSPLLDGVAVVNARYIANALICSGCDRVGVACTCKAAA
jgi:hypothetical protein